MTSTIDWARLAQALPAAKAAVRVAVSTVQTTADDRRTSREFMRHFDQCVWCKAIVKGACPKHPWARVRPAR